MNAEFEFKQYEKRFGESLTSTYTIIMSNEKIIEAINTCLQKIMTYFETLVENHRRDIMI